MGQVVHGSSPSFEKDPAGQDAKNKRYVEYVSNPEAVMRGEKPIVKEVNILQNIFKK